MFKKLIQYIKWRKLLFLGRIRRHKPSAKELEALWNVVQRNLKDAAIEELSADRRFALAYSAALQISNIVITKAGYKVCGEAHHLATFKTAKVALNGKANRLLDYFEKCRKRRHQLEYYQAGVIKERQAKKILDSVNDYYTLVRKF